MLWKYRDNTGSRHGMTFREGCHRLDTQSDTKIIRSNTDNHACIPASHITASHGTVETELADHTTVSLPAIIAALPDKVRDILRGSNTERHMINTPYYYCKRAFNKKMLN
jgi:hypothetical protein